MMILKHVKSNKTVFLLSSISARIGNVPTIVNASAMLGKFFSRQISNKTELTFLNDKYSSYTFRQMNNMSKMICSDLLKHYKTTDLKGERIAVLCNNNYTYLTSILGIWMANGVPLGLNKHYPNNLIEYFINDANCKLVINGMESTDKENVEFNDLLQKYNVVNYRLIEDKFHLAKNDDNKQKDYSQRFELNSLNEMRGLMKKEPNKDGIILYTSGTTGKPKGVVLNFNNISSLCETLIKAWEFNHLDCVLHVLPLNHVHGLLYGLMTSLYNGNQVDMLPKFNAETVWSKLLDVNSPVNVFYGVPTVYVHLVNAYLSNPDFQAKYSSDRIKEIFKQKMRLLVCGSAPLNVKTYKQWTDITGYKLLDRYGMTEIGVGLSNPFDESKRIPGTVGRPYGNTTVRIVEQHDGESDKDPDHVLVVSDSLNDEFVNDSLKKKKQIIGELQIKGSMVFNRYHDKPTQTKESFTPDGWFKTGDTAEFLPDLKVYKLAGRTSVDVIKSGGFKISALDIEREILAHPQIDDVAIMGLSDATWGQKIFALLVLKENTNKFDQEEFIKWCKERLPNHSVPRLVKIIDKMPRNLLGKVNKKELVKKYEAEQ